MMGVRTVTQILLSFAALLTTAYCAQPNQRPNVVLIVADDLGWNDVSFHGSRQIPTPNLDALAYDGIILGNYYVQPICTPTRSALLTGRYPIHTGLQHGVIVSAQPYGLGLDEKLMSQYFKELDYNTHIVGKWHLGFHAEEYTPIHRGFDTHFGYYQGCGDYYDHTYGAQGPFSPSSWGLDFHNNSDNVFNDFGQYSTELFSNEAERIIQHHDTSKPMFLYLPHQAVHSGNPNTKTPLEAPWKYQAKFSHIQNPQRRMFAAMVSALDDAVGNVTKALDAKDMLKNTIILFTTDNGGPANGFDFNYANNSPLRGLKSTIWEGGTRASGFLWSPLLNKSGYTSQNLMHVTDWLPTLLHAAGYDMEKLPKNIDGMDLWDDLSQNDTAYRTEFLYNIDPAEQSGAIRMMNMKLIYAKKGSTTAFKGWYPNAQIERTIDHEEFKRRLYDMGFTPGSPEMTASTQLILDLYNYEVVDNERALHAFDFPQEPEEEAPEHMFRSDLDGILRKLSGPGKVKGTPLVLKCPYKPDNYSTNCEVQQKACLFDIDKDPCEFNNIADQFPDIVDHLTKRIAQYEKTMVAPRNKPNDPNGLPSHHNGLWVPWLKLSDIAQP